MLAHPHAEPVASSVAPAEIPAEIVAEEDEGIFDLSDASTAASLRSSLRDYPIEHGRQYHAYKDGQYHRPNDEDELERLDIMNEMFNLVNDRKLYRAPIGPTPHRILDIGVGTGIWCIDMGDLHPAAETIGVDIIANMPAYVPPNVKFEIFDIEDEWSSSLPFDYIHSRYMCGAIKDWPTLMAQTFSHLKPGCWAEFVDLQIDYYSQDGSLTEDHALKHWSEASVRGMEDFGQTLRPAARLETWMRNAGFTDVHAVRDPLPVGTWPKNKKLKQIGTYNFVQLCEGVAGMSLRLFLGPLGYSREELEVLLMEVRKDWKDPKVHSIYDMYTVWGQKPKK